MSPLRFFTNSDGQFSIVGEVEADLESLILRSRLPEDRCLSLTEEVISMVQFPFVTLGDLLFEKIAEQNFSITPNVTECETSVFSKVYFPAQQELSAVGTPIRELSMPVCEDKSYELLYVGVEDQDGEYFDGGFYESSIPLTNYTLEPCTSEPFFFELTYGGSLKELDNVVYNTSLGTFVNTHSNVDWTFVMEVDQAVTDALNSSNYSGKAIDFTAFDNFEYENQTDTSQNFEFTEGVYMDIVKNTPELISGIIMRVDQNMLQMKIRFRVQKV